MRTSLVNIVLFSSLHVLLSLTCFQDVVEAASGKGELIFVSVNAEHRAGHLVSERVPAAAAVFV